MYYFKLIGCCAPIISLLSGLGCVESSWTPAKLLEREYRQTLCRLSRSNTDPFLSDVERELQLGTPVDLRSPSFLDPYWWFTYLKNDVRIELAALPVQIENPPACEVCDRSQFRYCVPLYWIGGIGDKGGHRLDESGAARRTYRIRLTEAEGPDNEISSFLSGLDMTKIIRIDEIESRLQLCAPLATGAASSTLPMLSFEYLKDGCVIELFASEFDVPNGTLQSSWFEDRSQIAFTGYWTVSRPERLNRGPRGSTSEGP